MTYREINEIRHAVKEKRPLIHCITNPISITGCANAILSLGARPIMAEHPKEVSEITETASALMLNLGNITDARMESMLIASDIAAKKNIPVTLDLVGVACSTLRRKFASEHVNKNTPAILKGNYSEIMAFFNEDYKASGVDAEVSLQAESVLKASAALAKKYNCTVLASGKTDIITDGKKAVSVYNGTEKMSSITGTGCMLGAFAATFSSASDPFEAAVSAAVAFGICGEKSECDGAGSFSAALLDSISLLSDADIEKYMKAEDIIIG
ncbi:MAG: hydroxyethylthiazole kinase [Clostridia bacterium]|nr:hydroxyethylthiazole kinase [Clostridia bacterium]